MPFSYLSDYAPLIRGLALETDLELPQSVNLPFDLFLQGEGWSSPETHASGWFRWLGDTGVGVVRVLVDRSRPAYLRLEVFAKVNDAVLQSTRVICDGEPVETRVVAGGVGDVIEGLLPSRDGASLGMTTIEVVAALKVKGQGDDDRLLSIALQRLIVTPIDDGAAETRKVSLVGDLLEQFDHLEELLAVKPRQGLWRDNLTYGEPTLLSLYDQPGYAHLKIRIDEAEFGDLKGLLIFNLRRGVTSSLGVEFRVDELGPDFRRLFSFPLEDEYGPRTEFYFTPDQRRRRWSLKGAEVEGELVRGLLTALAVELDGIVEALGSKIDRSPVDWLALARELSAYARGGLKEATVGAAA